MLRQAGPSPCPPKDCWADDLNQWLLQDTQGSLQQPREWAVLSLLVLCLGKPSNCAHILSVGLLSFPGLFKQQSIQGPRIPNAAPPTSSPLGSLSLHEGSWICRWLRRSTVWWPAVPWNFESHLGSGEVLALSLLASAGLLFPRKQQDCQSLRVPTKQPSPNSAVKVGDGRALLYGKLCSSTQRWAWLGF